MIIILDTETTGLTPDYACLLEIAGLAIDDDCNVVAQFHEYIKPNRPIPSNITAINHISNDDVANCRSEREVLESFREWCIGLEVDTIIAHNAKFDMKFLLGRADTNYVKYDVWSEAKVIDTLKICRDLVKTGKIVTKALPDGTGKDGGAKQEQIARALNITYFAHNALEDAFCLSKIWKIIKTM